MTFSEVVLSSATEAATGPVAVLAKEWADRFDARFRVLHVPDDPAADADDVGASIAASLTPRSLLVMASEHADAWRSRNSVAEHATDAFGGVTAICGPHAFVSDATGPVLAAVDGSELAERALPIALEIASTLGRPLSACQVLPENGPAGSGAPETGYLESLDGRLGEIHIEGLTLHSNDVVGALARTAAEISSCAVVLASHGDRRIPRATMSRTATGLAATAPCPVFVVGPKAHGEPSG